MARAQRIEYKGAWYHVMNRGAGRKKIYHTKKDYELFIELLSEITIRYQIEIHAYCLMPNHYHLLINTPFTNLSEAMRHLNGVYTQRFNKSKKTDGPLFRGRFKSMLIEEDKYFLTLSRYIHLNPVVAQIVKKPEHYEWSSYNSYLKTNKAQAWIKTKHTLNKFGGNLRQKKYHAFVKAGIIQCKKVANTSLKKVKKLPILGSEAFVKTIIEKYLTDFDPNNSIFDIPIKKSLRPTRDIDLIIKIIAKHYQIDAENIKTINNYKKRGNLPRSIAIYLSSLLSNKKCREIGEKFSNISHHAVSKIYRKMKNRITENTGLANKVNAITDEILKYKVDA